MRQLTCTKCGWVHMGVTREYAERSVAEFNAFYYSAEPKVQECYGGPATIETYEVCFLCGTSYKYTRPTIAGDAPDGVTIQPIIDVELETFTVTLQAMLEDRHI